jgi:hypothetical protein
MPGEGFLLIAGAEPLTPTLSTRGEGLAVVAENRGFNSGGRDDSNYPDKFSSNKFSACDANACMLACRSVLPVSSVMTDDLGPAIAMQL